MYLDMTQLNQNTKKLLSLNHLNIYRLKKKIKGIVILFVCKCTIYCHSVLSSVLIRPFSRLHDWNVMFVAVGGV